MSAPDQPGNHGSSPGPGLDEASKILPAGPAAPDRPTPGRTSGTAIHEASKILPAGPTAPEKPVGPNDGPGLTDAPSPNN